MDELGKNDKYAYIFVDDKGKDLWFSYRYGKTYPCRIHNSSIQMVLCIGLVGKV